MKAWVVMHPDLGGVLVYAETRGKARWAGASEMSWWGAESENAMACRVRRAPAADHLAAEGGIASDEIMRQCGFTDESGQTCDACGLGDPTCGEREGWTICWCGRCGECGCSEGCVEREEAT